jgi:hypothetical protein
MLETQEPGNYQQGYREFWLSVVECLVVEKIVFQQVTNYFLS